MVEIKRNPKPGAAGESGDGHGAGRLLRWLLGGIGVAAMSPIGYRHPFVGGMIRVMGGNLPDEYNKPYVITARAKGARPIKPLVKYPVRIALNPFIPIVGYLFRRLISGGAIVAIVLGVHGTLVSDLLLLWFAPRIRMEGGAR